MLNKRTIISLGIGVLLIAGLGLTLFVVQRRQTYKSKATLSDVSPFKITSDKTALKPGETVTFTGKMMAPDGSLLIYEGEYEVEVERCLLATSTTCEILTGDSLSWIRGRRFSAQGTLVITIPTTPIDAIYKIRFQPKGVG